MLKFLPIFFLLLSCSFGPGNLQSKHATDLEARQIRRIAVLPPRPAASAPPAKVPPAAQIEQRANEREAPDRLAKSVYSATVALPNWQIISESEMREVEQSLGTIAEAARPKRVGEMVYADAIIMGRILRYRERVGDEWGAKSPASVSFTLDLVDVRRGDIIWSARFDETQKPLTENIFAIGEISQRGFRWLSAEQLMDEGVKKSIAQLHQLIGRPRTS